MSWMKRRGHTTPSPAPAQGPPVQMYNPNQHDWNQQSGANSWYNQGDMAPQQTNYWQQPQYPQVPQQQQQHSAYNQYQYSQPNVQPAPYYQQNVSYDQTYSNGQQQQYPGYTQQQQQNVTYDQKPEADSWNWGWGDEDNSNLQQNPTNANVAAAAAANNVAESFANDESWNWNVEESSTATNKQETPEVASTEVKEVFPQMGELAKKHKVSDSSTPENLEYQLKPEQLENYESVSLDQLPPMPTGRRNNKEHLTPQWSIESQVSQESSDDILQTSESDKSHMFSRSSTISHSPVSETPLDHAVQYEKTVKQDVEYESFSTHENKEILTRGAEQSTPPPKNFPPTGLVDDSKNPYKRNIGLSHKAINKTKGRSTYSPFTQSVNLETVPDNSEQPDLAQHMVPLPQKPSTSQFPDNNEVAPINDRNQYLETGQLSDENTAQPLGDNIDALPPPGLSRMVLGQMEGNATQSDNEPPPGLSRMVLGQTETSTNNQTSPPAGLHRMIPGESSSPETNRYQNHLEDDYVSENELSRLEHITPQSRSATIGADTPPTNRSETIGANVSVERETNLDGANTLDSDRRDSIEGQPQTDDVTTIVSSIRDLTVGENPTDITSPTDTRRDSDSDLGEQDRSKSPRRRFKEERREKDRNRGRYSPEYSREKRTDRRRYRDRYFEDDTDYYSDKERDRRRGGGDERDRREEYARKYGNSKNDKEKEKSRRRDGREYRDRRDYYYNRYEDGYEDVHSRSRPSSRSDSLHDSYRERGHERDHRGHRERDRDHRRHRDVFNPYMQGYGYDPYNPYYQQYQYQYLENLRRTNPQAYAEWYRKYYQQSTSGPQSAPYGSEDKTSVHSGRSSTNDELAKERYLRQSYYGHASLPHMGGYYREHTQSASGHYGLDDSSMSRPFDYTDSSINYEDTSISQRLTPAKFSTAHVKASIASGHLLKIPPHYPLDGQSALVELGPLRNFIPEDNDELRELTLFPGPLVKGVTHKKTIIEYCEGKIRNHTDVNDPDSYILMWELLILLLRQNGMVVGADIAELLMKNRQPEVPLRPSSVLSNISSAAEETNMPQDIGSQQSILKEEVVTNKFREYLLYGSEKEALEWAMKNSLWGHALFLASKLDKRTYANVMMRFANGLPMNDPLQTLYQLLSGRLPAAVTSVSDEKWGDWRPHLAMILSNTTQRPELDRKAITTLADTLIARGSIYAAQFCYLMAEIGFSRYGSENAKLVLLGANHKLPFDQFSTSEAIHMTEVYEYARSLSDPTFIIPEFQAYKFLIATRLSDYGYLESALAYLEQVTNGILQNPTNMKPSLINRVCELAEKLKYYDPIGDTDETEESGDTEYENSRADTSWLKNLKIIQNEYNMGLITHESINNLNMSTPETEMTMQQTYEQVVQDPWQIPQQQSEQIQQNVQQRWQPEVHSEHTEVKQQEHISHEGYNTQYNDQYSWSAAPQQWGGDQNSAFSSPQLEPQPESQQPNDYWNAAQTEEAPRPQISMPNQSNNSYADDEERDDVKKPSPAKAKPNAPKEDKNASSSGWFGGIWSRLALRPKNQMKLPDDKNPTIVWDQEKKRWVNLEEDGNEGSSELKPPPKMTDIMPKSQPSMAPMMNSYQPQHQQDQFSSPAPPEHNHSNVMPSNIAASTTDLGQPGQKVLQQPNMFKMQRNRNLKKSYVDVFNPGGKTTGSAPALLPNSDPPTFNNPAPQMNFFIPAPVADPNAPIDFLTPGGMMTQIDPNVPN